MKRKKFILVNTEGEGMRIHLNEEGRNGWHFVKMEPFYQLKRDTASHGIGKFALCLERNKDLISFYRVKFLHGKRSNDFSFRINHINEMNEQMERCGFEFIDFHHVVVFHLDPGYNRRHSMKGYMAVWGSDMERDRAEMMIERMQKVTETIAEEFDINNMRGAPNPKEYMKIKDKADEYRKRQDEYDKKDEEFGFHFSRIKDRDEDEIIREADAYEYLVKFINRVIDLDNRELKKQMGKDWDEGILDVKPDIEAVIESLFLSYILDSTVLVEQILWSCEGNLIVTSLPEDL